MNERVRSPLGGMCLSSNSCGAPLLGRRALLAGLGGLGVAPLLSGCDAAAPLIVSSDEVERLGVQAWAQMRAKVPLVRDGSVQELVRSIAERLLAGRDADAGDWEVAVFASPQVNAFVLPGRKIGVFQGMVEVAGGEGELAAVVGHEIGHIDANHPEERVAAQITSQWGVDLASRVLNLAGVEYGPEIAAALGIGIEYGIARPYGRSQEIEADRLGVEMMARAGYDPNDAVRFWQRMDAMPRRGFGRVLPGVLSTHPAPRRRISELEEIARDVRGLAGR